MCQEASDLKDSTINFFFGREKETKHSMLKIYFENEIMTGVGYPKLFFFLPTTKLKSTKKRKGQWAAPRAPT